MLFAGKIGEQYPILRLAGAEFYDLESHCWKSGNTHNKEEKEAIIFRSRDIPVLPVVRLRASCTSP
jgi:hypothetical protein